MVTEFQASREIQTSWIERLAFDEINMDKSGVVNLHEHLGPEHLLEESSIRLMDAMRDRAEVYVTRFNELRNREGSEGQIKIFKISGSVNDFMLFRNSMRLVFSRKSSDLITIGFLSSNGSMFSARNSLHGELQNMVHEIRAHLGAFNKISWQYATEPVDVDAMLRFYLSEFIQLSAK